MDRIADGKKWCFTVRLVATFLLGAKEREETDGNGE